MYQLFTGDERPAARTWEPWKLNVSKFLIYCTDDSLNGKFITCSSEIYGKVASISYKKRFITQSCMVCCEAEEPKFNRFVYQHFSEQQQEHLTTYSVEQFISALSNVIWYRIKSLLSSLCLALRTRLERAYSLAEHPLLHQQNLQ